MTWLRRGEMPLRYPIMMITDDLSHFLMTLQELYASYSVYQHLII